MIINILKLDKFFKRLTIKISNQVRNISTYTYGGVTYGDWYLPSKYELSLLYLQRAVVGGFTATYYWSSTEYTPNLAWGLSFSDGNSGVGNKDYATTHVRAIRAF
jgi:hypothetical protein